LVSPSAYSRSINHFNHSPDGRVRLFLGGYSKVCLCKSRSWTIYKVGFSLSETTAHIIATGEIIGGLLLIFGLFTRITAFYFIVQMIVAVLSTKIDLYFGRSPLPMPPAPPKMGIWAVFHEIRSDYAQILTCLFLLIEGAGRRSLDFIITASKKAYRIGEKSLPVFKENQPQLIFRTKKKNEYPTVNEAR
jgi:uncharacterized membrane protein YphA (DoxX/SURF4 family)